MSQLVDAARQSALIVPRPDLRTLEVTGEDRLSWLQGIVTNDLAPLQHQRAVYALCLNKKGKIVADMHALRASPSILLSVHHSVAAETLAHLDHFLVMEDAEIRAVEPPHQWLHVIGPQAPRVLQAAASHDGLIAAAPASFPEWGGAVLLCRSDALDAIMHAFASLDGVASADLETWDRIRPILGLPRFPIEFDTDCYPQEIGLDERAVSFSKGCYLGQEIVVKMRSRGHPSRTLVRLVAPSDHAVPLWAESTDVLGANDAQIGRVLSAARSELQDIAFALVKWSDAKPGAVVRVGGRDARLAQAWGTL